MGRSQTLDTFLLKVLCSLFLLGGATLLVSGIVRLQHARRSTGWPTTEGVITLSRPAAKRLRFEYKVEGQTYSGDRFAYGSQRFIQWEDGGEVARRRLQKYPEGRMVKVFYDPEKPSRAVLEPGLRAGTWTMPAVGVLVIVGAAGGLLLLGRQDNRNGQ